MNVERNSHYHFDKETTLVITGAGVSVESGIRPFRGPTGIWEEDLLTMATFKKFREEPLAFLPWYFHRFISAKDALPNETHRLLAKSNVRVITQNVDALHVKAGHQPGRLIEIHGNIFY